jgi:2-polyprenyl-3-methyl-5-hydroxy-6-metoxy-1,4-benzoquinol methylase
MPADEHRSQNLIEPTSQSSAEYWDSVYRERDLNSIVDQYRQAAALHLVDALQLPKESHVLELGCGAGVLTIALARRKYIVSAIDRVRASLDLVHQRAINVGLQDRIITRAGDIHSLESEHQSFDLIIALGVLPWLKSPAAGMSDITRMLKPGGYAIMTVHNRWRINHFLDLRSNPLMSMIREAANNLLETLKLKKPDPGPSFPQMHSIKEFDSLITSMGLNKSAGRTIAFGPITLMNKRIFSDSTGKTIHRLFQRMAERNVPLIRSAGSQYLVLAQKPESVPHQNPVTAKVLAEPDLAKTESYPSQQQA